MTSSPSYRRTADGRPEFMVTLGLQPPYTQDDVKQAYLQRAKQLHPDHGGSAAEFHALHTAYERAREYIDFRGDRRGWIAAKMNAYIAMQEAIEKLRKLGAEVTTHAVDWLKDSLGDFSQLAESIERVRLVDSPRGDDLIHLLVEQRPALRELHALELPGCQVTARALSLLAVYPELRRLDLSRTTVRGRMSLLVDALPRLDSLQLDGTAVGWLDRLRLRWKLNRRRRRD